VSGVRCLSRVQSIFAPRKRAQLALDRRSTPNNGQALCEGRSKAYKANGSPPGIFFWSLVVNKSGRGDSARDDGEAGQQASPRRKRYGDGTSHILDYVVISDSALARFKRARYEIMKLRLAPAHVIARAHCIPTRA